MELILRATILRRYQKAACRLPVDAHRVERHAYIFATVDDGYLCVCRITRLHGGHSAFPRFTRRIGDELEMFGNGGTIRNGTEEHTARLDCHRSAHHEIYRLRIMVRQFLATTIERKPQLVGLRS